MSTLLLFAFILKFSPNETFTFYLNLGNFVWARDCLLSSHYVAILLQRCWVRKFFKGNVIDHTVKCQGIHIFHLFVGLVMSKLSSSMSHDFLLCSKTYLKNTCSMQKVFLRIFILQLFFKLFSFRSREHGHILIIIIVIILATNNATSVHHGDFCKLPPFTISKVPGNLFY